MPNLEVQLQSIRRCVMGAEFEEFLVEGQLFRRYTKRDNLPSCRFVEGKARALTEISIPEKPKKGRLSRDTAGDVRRNADIYTVADKNLKNELTKNLPTGFDWKAPDVEDKLESHREALANCFPDWVSKELKEGLMD
ncbi:MAG: hypothetical protein K0R24_2453, partial [Gammaproteobacteria bacterium]|nr:hypothetical protein [Gammaproteobacteria bacterium]